jgi:phospholipid/cholesterol/gamma-HCH transport system substrate-binding protein
MDKERRLEVTVGLFVLATAVVAVVAVLLLGRSRHVFEQRATLRATFRDVAGLAQGAPVRLSGVNVGTVSRISFVRAARRPLIEVDMQITQSALGLVRQDSLARISSQGLLGDKIVEISAGTTAAPLVETGGEIKTAEAPDLDRMLRQAEAVLDDARRVADRLAVVVDQVADARTMTAIRQSLLHLHALLHEADKGGGLVHALFYDRRTADELDRVLAGVDRLVQHVDRGVQRIDSVLDATDDNGRQLLNHLSRAAEDVGTTARRIGQSPALANLERATGDVAEMTAAMRRGQGTLGALLVDPTIYDQLVSVLGGIGRSRILRALVRYAISRDPERGQAKRVVDQRNIPPLKPPPSPPKPKSSPSSKASSLPLPQK